MTILIIDAQNIFIQHFCANQAMSSEGKPTGGIIGFLYFLRNIVDITKPKIVLICWEGENGARKKKLIYKEYKAHRKARLNRFYEDDIPQPPENKYWQNLILVELLKCLPICQLFIKDLEADDIVGYIAKYKFQEQKKIIASSDKDFYQLLKEDEVLIYSPSKKIFITEKETTNNYGISPENFCLAKCLSGDASDNIDGIKGAGFKTISKRFPVLIEKTPITIDYIIETAEEFAAQKKCLSIFKEIVNNKHILYRNWKLMHLDTNNIGAHQIKKIEENLLDFKPKYDKMSFINQLIENKIESFNADSLFFSLNYLTRTNQQ